MIWSHAASAYHIVFSSDLPSQRFKWDVLAQRVVFLLYRIMILFGDMTTEILCKILDERTVQIMFWNLTSSIPNPLFIYPQIHFHSRCLNAIFLFRSHSVPVHITDWDIIKQRISFILNCYDKFRLLSLCRVNFGLIDCTFDSDCWWVLQLCDRGCAYNSLKRYLSTSRSNQSSVDSNYNFRDILIYVAQNVVELESEYLLSR